MKDPAHFTEGLVGSPIIPYDPDYSKYVDVPNDVIYYDPTTRVNGWEYYSIGQILGILYRRCKRDPVRALCEAGLTYQPTGLELRNSILLPLRVQLQGWSEGYRLHVILVTLVQRLLDDSVEGGPFDYNRLNLQTVVAWDQASLLRHAVQVM